MWSKRATKDEVRLHPTTRLVALLLFGSGLSALLYQTAWQRMLQLVFGASTAASAAVLGIFLGGLGLGGAWLSARAERHPKPLFLYGNLELGVALAAAVSPLLVELAGLVYFRLGGSGTLGWFGATLVRLVLAVLVMGPAVVLMGGTLPAAARAVESEDDAARGRLAILYAVNTSGAVVGALLGTFLLFELLGVRLSLWGACLINALVAIVARGIGRGAEPVPVREQSESKPAETEPAVPTSAPPQLVYGIAGVVGFAFLYLELIWYRMLSPLLGGSSFTFGLVLAVTLAGIGLGGYAYSRRDERRVATLSLLAATLALEALTVAIPLAFGDRLAIFAAHVRELASLGFGALVVSWTVVTLIVVFPAAFVSGYQFPVLFALLGRGRQGVARHVGLTYAFNTMGSIGGAIFGGFVLLPRLGAVTSWRVIAVLLAISALAVVALAVRREAFSGPGRFRTAVALVAGVLALIWVHAEGPTAAWRHRPIGVGRMNLSNFNPNELEAWRRYAASGMVWERDGLESSVALDGDNGFAFIVNGKSDGSVLIDRATMGFTALLPALLHENPKSVFVLGLGTGMSAGWVARAPGVERVDVAELEPAIVEVARASAAANFSVLDLPNVHVFLGDGREFLLTSKRSYDIIASEPSNPYRAGIASLLTREFYVAIEERLNPRGIFVQWIQTYEVDALTLRVVLRTVREVFPFVEAWQTQWGDMLLIATREKLVHDADAIRQRIQQEPYKRAMRELWLVQDAEGVLSHFLANHELIATLSEPGKTPLNTDDQNVLEYSFARRMEDVEYDPMLELLTMAGSRGADRPELRGAVDWVRVSELRPRAFNISGSTGRQVPIADANAQRRARAVDAGCLGQLDNVMDNWTKQPRLEPLDSIEVFVLALGAARAKDEARALELAGRLEQQGLVAEAELVRARLRSEQKQPELAAEAALKGLRELRRVVFPLCETARQTIFLLEQASGGDPGRARTAALALLEAPLAGQVHERGRQEAAFRLSMVSGDLALCARALGRHLEQPIWDGRFLANRFICLERTHHPLARQAREDFEKFLANTPGRFGDALDDALTPEKLLAESASAAAPTDPAPASTLRDALRR